MRRLSFRATDSANNYAAHRRPKTSLAEWTSARGNSKGNEEADVAAKGNYRVEESKKVEWKMEKAELWTHIGKAHTSKSHQQTIAKTKTLGL